MAVVAKEVNDEIKQHVTFRSVRAVRQGVSDQEGPTGNKYNHSRIWHVQSPHYRLTHLLEHGHALRNGGRARAFPHIIYGEQLAERRMLELTEQAVQDVGR